MKGIFKYIYVAVLVLGLFVVGEGVMWGKGYSNLIPTVVTNPGQESGVSPGPGIGGKVGFCALANQPNVTWNASCELSNTGSLEIEYYILAEANTGYHFKNWILPSDKHGAYKCSWMGDYNENSNPAKMRTWTGNSFGGVFDWNITAVFEENFKAKMTANVSGMSGSATVDGSNDVVKDVTSSSTTITYNIVAPTPSAGYYFVGWTGSGIANPSSLSTTVTVSPSTSPGGVAEYTVTAVYAQKKYYATLSATSGAHGSISVPEATKYTTTQSGNLNFTITVTPEQYYHLEGITFTQGSGSVSGNTVTVQASSNYAVEGSLNAAQYTINATFARDKYNVSFAKNSSTATGTMSPVTYECGVNNTLPALGFTDNITVTFRANGGFIATNNQEVYAETKSKFNNWSGSDGVTYANQGTINKSTTTAITLTAQWNSNAPFVCPNATRGDRTLNGYNHDGTGTWIKAHPGETVWPESSYDLIALWGDPFYSKVNISATSGSGATPTVDATEKSSDNKNKPLTFDISTPATTSSGYHFTGWSATNATIASSSSTTTTATVSTSMTAGSSNATVANVTANYAQSIYFAKLTATAGENGTVSVTQGTKSTTTQGGNVTFDIVATPAAGYHLVEWTKTGEIGTFGSTTATTTTFTAPAATSYDEGNAVTYTVHATFAQDEYKAQLSSAINSISDASSSTAKISSDNTNWVTTRTIVRDNANENVTFYVQAIPAEGYKFMGWSETNGSSTTVAGLGATGTYVVKSAATQGQTNSKNLYAIFKKEYTIVINANGTASTDRVVFNVSGPSTYRVSVPVGGSVTLKDVTPGTYTVSVEPGWSWGYNVSPASTTAVYDIVNKSVVNFSVSSKASTKKHGEVTNIIVVN